MFLVGVQSYYFLLLVAILYEFDRIPNRTLPLTFREKEQYRTPWFIEFNSLFSEWQILLDINLKLKEKRNGNYCIIKINGSTNIVSY